MTTLHLKAAPVLPNAISITSDSRKILISPGKTKVFEGKSQNEVRRYLSTGD